MKTIYIDSDFKCHVSNNGTMTIIKTDAFDNKCDAFIEGYRFIPNNAIWTREDGVIFTGEMIAPWKPYSELDAVQREYERQQLAEANTTIAELDAALLDTTYNYLLTEE